MSTIQHDANGRVVRSWSASELSALWGDVELLLRGSPEPIDDWIGITIVSLILAESHVPAVDIAAIALELDIPRVSVAIHADAITSVLSLLGVLAPQEA